MFRKYVPEQKCICGSIRKYVPERKRVCGRFRKYVPEWKCVCGEFRKSFPSGITFAEHSANLSFFDFWPAHHVFIDVLKRALHASDCHALYPIYTIDADDFIRL